MEYLSIDAETNGLWGHPFAVAATLHNQSGEEIDYFVARVGNENVTNQWVKDNVLPTLDFEVTHASYEDMLSDFSKFYLTNKNATTLWHVGHVVEAFLFRECVRLGFIGEWDAPYTPIEVSEVLRHKGFNPSSVDTYVKEKGLPVPTGSTHNPLYDCRITAAVYFHIKKKKNNMNLLIMTAATVVFGALVVGGILDDYHHPSKKTSNVPMIIGMIGLLMILIALFIWPPFVAAN